jgi:proteasome assembly chaperone 3
MYALVKNQNQIQASIPETSPLPSLPTSSEEVPEPPASIQLTTLFGAAPSERIQTLHSIYATHVATLVWVSEAESIVPAPRRPVIVGIALKLLREENSDEAYERDKDIFNAAMKLLRELLQRS